MSYRDDLSSLDAHVLEAEIATPCMASWADMKGDKRVRHCGDCNKHVYNFAELTRDEIDALINKHEGTLCARLFVRADGMMITRDCAVLLRKPSHLFASVIAASAVVAGIGLGAIVGAGVGPALSASPPAPSSLAEEQDALVREICASPSSGVCPPPPEEEYVGQHDPPYREYLEVAGLFNATPAQRHLPVK